ncbi:N-acetyl-gamma-glutamyl-phosphate reductase [Brevibacillus sp. FSL K6-0770]|jgi:N-acetyl-gamma-glutamyl-phosphate reductase, common form|uniref:N-acetyl-gamma-glutamyl-phosphate reductase n=1 Tax=Brevibacillus parabrevis TaxID=54914 RepID=A0A4Y3PKU9_BREPA|nr:N-acetyl-gamma-glutamyl-phosphate reductase [Brevibacillus parabrevis]MBU8713699.1 N-acetyl-gamma-glutamyl-phosphate reductase [Brevibacillus parabrevis]MDR4997960.1 N-acetyl-gamma-glutamyl-phosphate reductase [Brevibacillus parabrevis]MED2256195.1 N-acetyl-gamma-glutamyl-phosphate reductase [Brevibacillus parabrevis]RNB93169.1 N-acetyl-gamma-glutamyl-phosphate reductase [Brevibacillus parabrevis]GEB35132.1 N-acetyl-gamma-glutamyl-phosphate reductase [Brevibacillus parabrevis]
MVRVGIVGATGYGGAELIRLLAGHPQVEIANVYSSSADGEGLEKTFPHVSGLGLPKLLPIDADSMSKANDLIFLATPAGVSAGLSPQLVESGVKVIDLSGDFRLEKGDVYKAWYKKEPAPASFVEQAAYGLTEWNQEQVAGASLIANPGCYPTAALLALIPLMKSGWVKPNSWIVDAKSGVSGAGRGVSLGVHYSEINESIHAYKVGSHQHTPEIEQELHKQSGVETIVQFTPHLVPMTRGILVTAYGQLSQEVSQAQIQELYEATYADKPFVRVRPAGSYPHTKEVYGSNYCDIAIHVDQRTGRVVLLSVIDNMMKGAAGQAVQNMNVMFGMPEKTGLPLVPVFP